ncbi:hypothetical protein ZYGR_0AG06730 [Zygosaccharomyces rouxii]|uniref:20S-pre-rRNA D-site endonuclease NOB1 n=1 Tax=Zygosaccharomyces rouxii TaxID=4956 RepID=A0A1Q3AAF1_ZYGRO|nr:hypothetical protein ZYGR_0AG06730 [Zygosaccharomyces rouxii]
MTETNTAHVRALVLDATPLISQPYSHYQNFAQSFYTTPTVFGEIRDVNARKNLEIWKGLGSLTLRHPKQESIKRVSTFAKLTGDYMVLSANDIHILALAHELEVELNKGDWRLRKKPGDSLDHLQSKGDETNKKSAEKPKKKTSDTEAKSAQKPLQDQDQDQSTKKKSRRRGGKKQRAKKEERENTQEQKQEQPIPENESKQQEEKQGQKQEQPGFEPELKPEQQETSMEPLHESDGEYDDDDGDWISMDNLTEVMVRDSGQDTTGSQWVETTEEERTKALNSPSNQLALASGDFAVQNVALQLNLNLMNFMSGLRIRTLRNYMLRCHACFRIFPLPKDGKPKHFCPACGGEGTLLRCAVSVDAATGHVTPHLKANFQWSHRGNRYSIASPLSKNFQKKYGKKGHVHSKPQEIPILREDQKEYHKMMSQEDWTRRHNEKVLDNYIGGGTADNYVSPFAIQGLKHHAVRVGRGRYVNSSRRKR